VARTRGELHLRDFSAWTQFRSVPSEAARIGLEKARVEGDNHVETPYPRQLDMIRRLKACAYAVSDKSATARCLNSIRSMIS